MRGRKPVPSMLRKLHGNPRKIAMPKFEPMPEGNLSGRVPNGSTKTKRTGWSYALTNRRQAC